MNFSNKYPMGISGYLYCAIKWDCSQRLVQLISGLVHCKWEKLKQHRESFRAHYGHRFSLEVEDPYPKWSSWVHFPVPAPDASFILTQALGCSVEGSSNWIPATSYMSAKLSSQFLALIWVPIPVLRAFQQWKSRYELCSYFTFLKPISFWKT